jgi:hypothetical protein
LDRVESRLFAATSAFNHDTTARTAAPPAVAMIRALSSLVLLATVVVAENCGDPLASCYVGNAQAGARPNFHTGFQNTFLYFLSSLGSVSGGWGLCRGAEKAAVAVGDARGRPARTLPVTPDGARTRGYFTLEEIPRSFLQITTTQT